MKRTPLTTSVDQHRAWEQRTREKAMARRRESSREGRAPFARRRAALPKRGRNFARNRREQFGEKAKLVRPCATCGQYPTEPHHEPPRSLGGTSKDIVFLCRPCHRYREDLGSPEAYKRATGIDLLAAARRLEEEWRAA